MGGASFLSTNTHGWRGPPGPFDSSVIPAFRHSRLPSFPPSVVPALRHSCLPSFPPYPSFLPSVIPAFRHSRPPSVVPALSVIPAFRRSPSRHSRLPSFPPPVVPTYRHSRESGNLRLSVQCQPSCRKGLWIPASAGMTEGAGMTAVAGMAGTMRANPENEKAPRGPPTGIDDASRRHIMSGNPPDTPKLEM